MHDKLFLTIKDCVIYLFIYLSIYLFIYFYQKEALEIFMQTNFVLL